MSQSQPSFPDADAPACPVAVGDTIDGKYKIDSYIAFGGMGVVCKAIHVQLETPVAVKFVRSELISNEDAVSRFLNEAKAAAALKGEHIAHVVDYGRLDTGSPYMVMEYLNGSDLWSTVANGGALPIETAVDYVLQACEALAEAHAAHIIHRDIKPENLFLAELPDGSFSIKVLDFGVSKQLEVVRDRALTRPGSGLGSPYYMSPEQMCSPRDVDVRTDIWSMGCVLYVLFTGQLPFFSNSVATICAKVMNERPTPLRALRPEVPAALEAIVFRCLQKDRTGRFANVGELVRALEPFGSRDAHRHTARVERILARGSEPVMRAESNPNLVGVVRTPLAAVPLCDPLAMTYEQKMVRERRKGRSMLTVFLAAVIIGGCALAAHYQGVLPTGRVVKYLSTSRIANYAFPVLTPNDPELDGAWEGRSPAFEPSFSEGRKQTVDSNSPAGHEPPRSAQPAYPNARPNNPNFATFSNISAVNGGAAKGKPSAAEALAFEKWRKQREQAAAEYRGYLGALRPKTDLEAPIAPEPGPEIVTEPASPGD